MTEEQNEYKEPDPECMSLGTALDIAEKMTWNTKTGFPVFDCHADEHYQAFKKLAVLVRAFTKDDRDPPSVEAHIRSHRHW